MLEKEEGWVSTRQAQEGPRQLSYDFAVQSWVAHQWNWNKNTSRLSGPLRE